METLKILYIDDHPETSLSKYLDKYIQILNLSQMKDMRV